MDQQGHAEVHPVRPRNIDYVINYLINYVINHLIIRYDLPLNSKMAIVTFSNDSVVRHPMVRVDGDDVRGRLADTIPDKYVRTV